VTDFVAKNKYNNTKEKQSGKTSLLYLFSWVTMQII